MLFLLAAAAGCGGGKSKHVQEGMASWYGDQYAGRPTASGEIFKPRKNTAAHNTLPFGTIIRVTNLHNGKSVKVRINDRGPSRKGRILDLSKGAAQEIDMIRAGVVPVRLEVLKWGPGH